MQMGPSAYYVWLKRPATLITEEELHLYRRAKALFIESRESVGSRQLMNELRTEGFQIGRYKTGSLMKRLKLTVKQRVAY